MTVVIRIPLAGIVLIVLAVLLLGGMFSYTVHLALPPPAAPTQGDLREAAVAPYPIEQAPQPETITLDGTMSLSPEAPADSLPVPVPVDPVVSEPVDAEWAHRDAYRRIDLPFVSEASRIKTIVDREVSKERGAFREHHLKNSRPVVVAWGDPGTGRRLLPPRTRWDEDSLGPKPNDLRMRGVSGFESHQVLATPSWGAPIGSFPQYGSAPVFGIPVPVGQPVGGAWDIGMNPLLADFR